jgi:uncharacterized protein YkwD
MGYSRALSFGKGWFALPAALAVLTSTSTPANMPVASAAGSRYRFHRAERCMMRKINHARARRGLSRLNRDKQLGYVARRHARRMANRGYIFHDSRLGAKVTRWRSLGQNVGRGGGCKRLFRAFMHSVKHRSNILGAWRFVGVGAKRRGGRIYVQHVFELYRDPGNVYHYP